MVIYLLTGEGRIVGISLGPVESPALPDALSMLATLDVAPIAP